jgi:hypothetical protein
MPIGLGAATDLFCAAKAAEGASPRTLEWYRMILVRAVRWFGEARPVDAIPAADIRAWLLELRSSLAPESIAGYVRGLKAFGNWCAEDQRAAKRGGSPGLNASRRSTARSVKVFSYSAANESASAPRLSHQRVTGATKSSDCIAPREVKAAVSTGIDRGCKRFEVATRSLGVDRAKGLQNRSRIDPHVSHVDVGFAKSRADLLNDRDRQSRNQRREAIERQP